MVTSITKHLHLFRILYSINNNIPELGFQSPELGISDLQNLGWALRLRWMWLQKTEPEKPWAFFPIQASPQEPFLLLLLLQKWGMAKTLGFGLTDGLMARVYNNPSLTCLEQWLLEQEKEKWLMHSTTEDGFLT